MTHRMIEDALGRIVGQDRQGNAIGLTLAEVATLEMIRDGWRAMVAHRLSLRAARDAKRRELVALRVSAGLVEA